MNLLAVDIGGTKTLLGVYTFDGKIRQLHKVRYLSSDWESFDLILDDFFMKLPSNIDYPKRACIGVAGNIVNRKVKLTNLKWELTQSNLVRSTKINDLSITNDFSCLIYAIPFLEKHQFKVIQSPKGEQTNQNNVVAIIGAGTGLGVAKGIISKDEIKALASEGGHQEFAPRTQSEWELSQWLKNNMNLTRVSIERVISGKGLVNIANWLLSKEDSEYKDLIEYINSRNLNINLENNESQIICDAAKAGDHLMKQVIRIWLSAYGSAAGDLALHDLCSAGLWIGGGTAVKHLANFRSEIFLSAFKNKGRFSDYLEKLPIMVLVDPESGLFGAACKAHLMVDSNSTLNLNK